ncbi:hypothetical protein CCR83_08430 [Rhodobacter veldkampii DSM 11550]|uniref:GIY-YIG domain-containing protein n=1 Tax=Phaeovulum veldkampii DSM 11550 TaxID=1185920 RepID=A0A2T4JAQ1_9RHOB|nr:hypothetical protein [Phaeovulum veldkampii]MBK5946455.1 hypothetical protein [Phaeovulum veldkampii DSM 11550]PTE14907.1 hypothetical protein C5F46_14350 [Phaeovulum veldkampii DSM 11550]TDQ53543.1 hypothetical protein EV658_1393 [Phaeovulum veldkampii DSM 11550]
MNLDALVDFTNSAVEEIAKHTIGFTLTPDRLRAEEYGIAALNWSSIPYGEAGIENVPDDRRGIYAFVVCRENGVLPPHHYVMYIGIAGRRSERALRDRYRDYLNEKKVVKRPRIARMIGTWHSVLCFYFAAVDNEVTSEQLENLEKALNNALMPPCSEGDLEAELKQKRRAFR